MKTASDLLNDLEQLDVELAEREQDISRAITQACGQRDRLKAIGGMRCDTSAELLLATRREITALKDWLQRVEDQLTEAMLHPFGDQ